jgi:hypothetical protein
LKKERSETMRHTEVLEDYMTHAADALTIDPTQRLKKQVEKLESVQANEIAELKAEVRKFKKEMLWNFKWVKRI